MTAATELPVDDMIDAVYAVLRQQHSARTRAGQRRAAQQGGRPPGRPTVITDAKRQQILQLRGRLSVSNIARVVELSRATVYRMLQHLDEGPSMTADQAEIDAIGGINYTPYLLGVLWPSESSRGVDGLPNLLEVTDMPPQQAAASLAKLLRWATNSPTASLLEVTEVGARQELVYRSRLGRALAARAVSLADPTDLDALFFRDSVDINVLMARVMVALHNTTGDSLEYCVDAAAAVVNALLAEWSVNVK